MGTSNSYGGPANSTPLVPTWLGDDDSQDQTEENNSEKNLSDAEKDKEDTNQSTSETNKDNLYVVSDRFRSARTYFTKFVGSNGRDKSALGKSLSNYISKSSGGTKNAAKRMGSSRRSAARFINFISSVSQQGITATLQQLNLGNLVGKSIEEIFLGLADYICPDGGSVDEGIARSAFIETIAELAETGVTDLESMTAEQMQTVFEIFATHTIEERLCNDIGNKICIAAENIQAVEAAQTQLHDFIMRSVSDALNLANIDIANITSDKSLAVVASIYETAFSILQTIAEEEAEK